MGATSTGAATRVPSTVVEVSTRLTFRRTRGRSRTSLQARALAASVSSSPEPPA